MSTQAPDIEFRRTIAKSDSGSLAACYQCGTCTAICPMNVPVRSIMRGAQVGIKDLAVSEALWWCATCRQCEVACPRGVDITGVIHSLREVSYKDRKVPAKLEGALWRVYEEGTAWDGKKNERGKWAEGLNVKVGKPAKHLLYLDDAACVRPPPAAHRPVPRQDIRRGRGRLRNPRGEGEELWGRGVPDG